MQPQGSQPLALAMRLAPNSELLDQAFVALEIARMQIVEQPAAFPNQPQEAQPRMMVLRVGFQMLRQLFNSRSENRYLDFGRSTVSGATSIRGDNFPLAGGLEGHQVYILPFSFT